MLQTIATVASCREIAGGIFLLSCQAPDIVSIASPGQFVNVRCGNGCVPLLRRPFSISRVEGDMIELLFNVVGQGTNMLSSKREGDALDLIGPLGVPFRTRGDFETAYLVGGGLGTAPFPFLTASLLREKKAVQTFVGARTAGQLIDRHLHNVAFATDDGSKGSHGTVVDLLRKRIDGRPAGKAKIYGCGPMKMLKALSEYAETVGIECELSLEGDMACGMGICQGCPVERSSGTKKYSLVCIDGPTFNSHDIILR